MNTRPYTHTFNTGIYSKYGYELFRTVFRNDYMAWTKSMIHGDGDYMYIPCFEASRLLGINNYNIPEIQLNFARVMPTGEIAASYQSRNPQNKITARKVINIIKKIVAKRMYLSFNDDPDFKDGIELIIRCLSKKLTKADYENPLYSKWIGKPLNPFKQEVLKDDYDAVNNLITKFQVAQVSGNYDVPDDFLPEDNNEEHRRFRIGQWMNESINRLLDKFLNNLA